MKYLVLSLCCCASSCYASQLSTSSASSTQTAEAQKADEAKAKDILDQYEKEFIKKHRNKEIAITAPIPDDYFAPDPIDNSYEGLAALLAKERTVVIIPPIPLEKTLKRLLKARAIHIIEDPYVRLKPYSPEPPTIYWIAYKPSSKNDAILLYNAHKSRFFNRYAEFHLIGYSDQAIKNGYLGEFEADKARAEEWLKEQAGTSSWKQLEDTFKSLEEDELLGNGGLYLEGFMARKSDEAILQDYYGYFEQDRKKALDWIKRASAELKLVP